MGRDGEAANNDVAGGGFLGLIGLPAASIITLDGQPFVLKIDDFVGLTGLPQGDDDHDGFHLVAIRAGPIQNKNNGSGECYRQASSAAAVTVGFVLPQHQQEAMVRQFDPTTEEVAATPVDEVTARILLTEKRNRRIDPKRVIDYHRMVPEIQRQRWKNLTSFVSTRLLVKRGIGAGDKIVPGSYDNIEDTPKTVTATTPMKTVKEIEDGKTLRYPCIPVVNAQQPVRHSQHQGTKRFLAMLPPTRRTELFTDPHPASRVLEEVLVNCYDRNWKDLLGDVQLSYVLFLHLHCYASLSHWRDLVAMLSAAERAGVVEQLDLYCQLLDVLACQLLTMEEENEFFGDAEFSGDNFLVPSFQQLTSTLSRVIDVHSIRRLGDSLSKLNRILSDKFPNDFGTEMSSEHETVNTDQQPMQVDDEEEDDDDDDDGPAIVPSEEIEISLARSEATARALAIRAVVEDYPQALRNEYPILFAAQMPSEDILMTCSRALDEASDVSLVREAAAYLEHVEARR